MSLPTIESVEKIQREIEDYSCDLMIMISDHCAEIEDEIRRTGEGRFDDFTEDEDGNPVGIVYPENGCEELDNARSHLHEAMEWIDMYLENRRYMSKKENSVDISTENVDSSDT